MNKIKVIMAKNCRGSEDGIKVGDFLKKKSYLITPALAKQFRLMGVIVQTKVDLYLENQGQVDKTNDLTDEKETGDETPVDTIITPETGDSDDIETGDVTPTKTANVKPAKPRTVKKAK